MPGLLPELPPIVQEQPGGYGALAWVLGTLGGLVGGAIGAALWAVILNLTRVNISYLAIGLGFLVGVGVALGARGRFDIGLSLFSGVLGLVSFFLALYFRLSLALSSQESSTMPFTLSLKGFFTLSLNDFLTVLGSYLERNPINFLYFVLIPLVAMGTAYRYINGRKRST